MFYVLDTKTCSRCGKIKTVDKFPATRNWCIACKKAYNKKYQKDFHAKKMLTDPDYAQRRVENVNRWRSDNRERARETSRNWKLNHKEQSKMLDLANRDRRRQTKTIGWATPEQIKNRMLFYGELCIYCKAPYEEVDHFFPLSKGGTSWPANLVPACRSCNRKKYNKNPWEFINSMNGEEL